MILHDLKRELLVHAVLIDPNITISDIRNPRLAISDILKHIRAVETLEFVEWKKVLVRKLPVIGMRDWLLIYEDTLVELSVKDAYVELEIVVV